MIGGTFEYLMSSLPNLSFQNTEEVKHQVLNLLDKYAGSSAETLSPQEIIDLEAQKYLPESAFSTFKKITLKNIHELEFRESQSKVLSAFAAFSLDLKNNIRAWRIAQKNNEKKSGKNELEKIIGEGNPLEKEIQLLKYQWDAVEDLSVGHFADIESVFTYKIKLMILLRWWSFDQKKGYNKFIQLTTNN